MGSANLRAMLVADDLEHGRALAVRLANAGGVDVSLPRLVAGGPLRFDVARTDAVVVALAGSGEAGLEVVRRTISASGGRAVVVVAQSDEPRLEEAAFESGVQDYLRLGATTGVGLVDALHKAVLRQRHVDALAELQGPSGQANAMRTIAAKNTQLAEANALLSIMMRELKRSWDELVQTEKLAAVGRLAAGAAHELNNPLMGILNYVQYCRERTQEDDPRYSRLTKAEAELKRCERIVRGMLTSAVGNAPAEPVRRSPVECLAAVERAADLLSNGIVVGGAELVIEVPAGLPACNADPDWLQQILINLITNAEDAVATSDQKRITIRAEQEGADIRFEVSDTGCGILGSASVTVLRKHMGGPSALRANATPAPASACACRQSEKTDAPP